MTSEYRSILRSRNALIALWTIAMIALSLMMWALGASSTQFNAPLWAALLLGGGPLVVELAAKALRGDFGSDFLAAVSIATSIVLGEYLAGSLVVLMLSGGETLEAMTMARASSVLHALSRRMPSVAHRKTDAGSIQDVPLDDLAIGDLVVVLPHEICPVDGTVVEGRGTMNESYLTGEPYLIAKTSGSQVLSGAINGDAALTIQTEKRAVDSRYARIMGVMAASAQHKPRMRRLADRLGAYYTPLALVIAAIAWGVSGEAHRFLAVLVVATPCPLLIAIPVAIIGSVSLAASRSIIIRDPSCLESANLCRTLIFDKTGTLTYGRPSLVSRFYAPGFDDRLLPLVGSLERFSKHPLAQALVDAAESTGHPLPDVTELSERPGQGLRGRVDGKLLEVTSRKKLLSRDPGVQPQLPPIAGGLECVIVMDGQYAATLQFRDSPRPDGASFIEHLQPRHHISRAMLVSGDRFAEVEYLAELVGIQHVYAEQSPEQKLEIVRAETAKAPTIYVGDGINDAPALTAATVGIAFGQNSDVTSEAADAVILESSLRKVDEFLHISRRMRRIALQSAVGGMALSVVGMLVAAAGMLSPVAGAIVQEVIDVCAVLNAARTARHPKSLIDFAADESAPE